MPRSRRRTGVTKGKTRMQEAEHEYSLIKQGRKARAAKKAEDEANERQAQAALRAAALYARTAEKKLIALQEGRETSDA